MGRASKGNNNLTSIIVGFNLNTFASKIVNIYSNNKMKMT